MRKKRMVSKTTPNKKPISILRDSLSKRELQVLKLIVEGCSDQTIAEKLVMALPTAKSHVRNILNKMAVDNRTQAAVLSVRLGLV
jgi:DNA-binding NarL/FixJ family response regulator